MNQSWNGMGLDKSLNNLFKAEYLFLGNMLAYYFCVRRIHT